MTQTKSILVVDNESAYTQLYRRWLADEYDVQVAQTGHAALEAISEQTDIVFLDRHMPNMMGDEVLSRIRDSEYDPRVAMVTGIEPTFEIIEMGFDEYLQKPVTREELRRTAQSLVVRATYNEWLQHHAALVAKRVTLEMTYPRERLKQHEGYRDLRERLEDAGARLEEYHAEIDPVEFASVYSNLAE
jgi:DNA-binding response OmpR family regulator